MQLLLFFSVPPSSAFQGYFPCADLQSSWYQVFFNAESHEGGYSALLVSSKLSLAESHAGNHFQVLSLTTLQLVLSKMSAFCLKVFSYWLSASDRNMGKALNTTVTCKIPEVRQDQIQCLKLSVWIGISVASVIC